MLYGVHCRVIFLWLCSKNLSQLTFDVDEDDSPEKILVDLKRGQTTYAVVFDILCRSAVWHSGSTVRRTDSRDKRPVLAQTISGSGFIEYLKAVTIGN